MLPLGEDVAEGAGWWRKGNDLSSRPGLRFRSGLGLELCPDPLDAPPDRQHGAVLSALLMHVCFATVRTLHRHIVGPCRCAGVAWSDLEGLTPWLGGDPRGAFRNWLAGVIPTFEREHPPSAAAKTAALVRAQPAQKWSLKELAR